MSLRAGTDLKTVLSALGHSTISTTADIHAHLTSTMQLEAAERLNKVIGRSLK